MAKGPGQVTVACPHCHAKQAESAFAKSTFCRKCGKHIDLRKVTPQPDVAPAETEKPGFFEKFTRLLKREKFREIRCFNCDAPQTISSFAESGSCIHCGTYMDLRDFKINGNFNRAVQTHGLLAVGKSGDITSSKILCGSAVILGKVHGNLQCTGTARMKMAGRITGAIEAQTLVIEKKSSVEFVRPLRAALMEISGKVAGRVYADAVSITKTGELEGSVHAKSITIEQGGIFHGDLFIGQSELEQPELLPAKAKTAKKKISGNRGDQPSFALA